MASTVHRQHIPWHHIPGKPLGRSIEHDEASRGFAIAEAPGIWRSMLWQRLVGIYDQGDTGDCTAESICGAVSTKPFGRRIRSQRTCKSVYHAETLIDGFGQPWPPNDRGSSGLAACKVAKERGWISSYQHAFNFNAAITALQTGPVITGVNWYEGFDQPDSNGLCTLSGSVRGGHELCIVGVDVSAKTVRFANSWGAGWGDHGYGLWTWDTWTRLLAEQGDATQPVR